MSRSSSSFLLCAFSLVVGSALPAHAKQDQDTLTAVSLQVGTFLVVSEHEQKCLGSEPERLADWRDAYRYWTWVGERWEVAEERIDTDQQDFENVMFGLESKSHGLGKMAASAAEITLCCLPETLAEAAPDSGPITRAVSEALGGERG